ncbi:MAG: hypothetical protein Q9214_006806, partial [Letrouitia sp. 1 TL-2023]
MGDPRLFSVLQLEESIKLVKEQLESLGTQHRDYAYLLSELSDLWLCKSRKTMQVYDNDQAIECGRQAVDAMLSTEPDPAYILGRLESLLFEKFIATGNKNDFEEAYKLIGQALKASKSHSVQWIGIQYDFNVLHLRNFKHFRNVRALDEVIESSRILVDLRNEGKSDLSMALICHIYSEALCEKAKVKGSVDELREGIAESYRALDACKSSDSEYPIIMCSLPVKVLYHYQSTQLLDILKEVMRLSQHALDTVPQDNRHRPLILLNHGLFLFHFSERVRNSDPTLSLSYLDQAITKAIEAILNTASDWNRYNLVQLLDNLSAWLGLKIKLTGDILSGQDSVEIAERALQHMPVEYQERPTVLNNLACTLDTLFEALQHTDHDKALEYLKRGIQVATSAVSESDEANSRYAERMLNLAAMHVKLCRKTADRDEFQKAKVLWLSASSCNSALPVVRVSASLKAGQSCFDVGDFETSYNMLSSAVQLLSRISPRWVPPADQQHLLSQGSGIAGLAAAAALQMERVPYEALRSLEMGRCVMSGLTMNVKDDVSELREAHPDLYKRYDSLRLSFSRGPNIADAHYLNQEKILSQVNDDLTA